MLGFRWSEKAKITSKFGKIFLSAFSDFLPFYIQWKLANEIYQSFKIYKRFDKEREKQLCSSQWEEKNEEKLDFVL